LNLLPFVALVDANGRYLAEHFAIVHVTSGRDLLRMQDGARAGGQALVLASPDFDAGGEPDQQDPRVASGLQRRSSDLQGLRFGALPGALDEAEALGRILEDARVLTGAKATETALKAAIGPRILHIATHGFFLGNRTHVPLANRGVIAIESGSVASGSNANENPLLRAGLALAGANILSDKGDDGILTALEASGLNLLGTKLVVLSACETGVGQIQNGEGVHGLRRAFALAGAESHVMSLWKVADDATRDLMLEYYRRLLAGEGRAEALRRVQLQMLRNETQNHPFYWAAFILSGAWSSLSDLRPEIGELE
jgi:CHAT domain-containing protein